MCIDNHEKGVEAVKNVKRDEDGRRNKEMRHNVDKQQEQQKKRRELWCAHAQKECKEIQCGR